MFLNASVVSNGFLFALKALLVELELTEKLFIYPLQGRIQDFC